MQYSIAELSQLSGISAHNIRIWERRYNALQPSRTTGNIRFYNDDQLKKLLNIAGLYHAGHKISKACAMGKEQTASFLQQKINSTIAQENSNEYYISQIISNGLEYNEYEVNRLITDSFTQNGVLETYKLVLYPLLVRIGLMWCSETICPSQEHFISAIIRQKLLTAIDNCITNKQQQSTWLLFLPEDEDHDIGLLLSSYLLRSSGHSVIYLGAKVPFFALSSTIADINPANILFFMTRVRPASDARNYIDQLIESFPKQQIFLSGNPQVLAGLDFSKKVNWLRDIHDFETIIKPHSL